MYYFDNAATTINKPKSVAQALYQAIMDSNLGNTARGGHGYSLNALEKMYEVRIHINEFFGGDSPSKVVLCPNITYALNIVINSLLEFGDHVITTNSEHNSVLRPLYAMEEKGVELSFLPLDGKGNIIWDDFKKQVKQNTKLLIVQHASNISGNVNDLLPIAKICYELGIFLIIDGAQSAGCLTFSMRDIDYPMIYCFTGHKSLYGPQGTGGMLIKGEYPFKQTFSGGGGIQSTNRHQPNVLPELFEFGTLNLHSNIALAEGIKYINKFGMDKIERDLSLLSGDFYHKVKEIENIKIYGDFTGRRVPLVALNIGEMSSSYVADILWNRYGIAVRGGLHCAPRYHESMGTQSQGQVRFSFSGSNTVDEIDYAVSALKQISQNKK